MAAFDTIVVGAGMAGVSTAALLQKRGYDTLLIEGQEDVGGRSSTFEYRGYEIDTGSHQLASFSSSGMEALIDDLGIELELSAVEPSLVHYDMETGEVANATAKERFPSEEAYDGFKEIVKTTVDLDRAEIARLHDITATEWIDDNIESDELDAFFRRITGFGGAPIEQVSAGAFLETMHDSFTSDQTIQYPSSGGIRAFPQAVLEAFRKQGGETAFGLRVNEITVDDGKAVGITGTRRRPGLTMSVDIRADRVVSTVPINALFNIFPREATTDEFVDKVVALRDESIVYASIYAGVEEELVDRIFGGTDHQNFQVTVEPTAELKDRIHQELHVLMTTPTYINPDQAPDGYELIYFEVHVPIDKSKPGIIERYHEVALDMLREMWPDFDDRTDWYHPVVSPNVLIAPPRQGLTGEHRPGFSVPDVEGMYLAGDGAYSSGSGIGSAVKSAWGASRRILLDDGRGYDGPIEPYLAVEQEGK